MHHYAKRRQNRLVHWGDIVIFQHSYRPPYWIFKVHFFCPQGGRPMCISIPNFGKIGRTVFEISSWFFDFQDDDRLSFWILEVLKFYCLLGSRGLSCIAVKFRQSRSILFGDVGIFRFFKMTNDGCAAYCEVGSPYNLQWDGTCPSKVFLSTRDLDLSGAWTYRISTQTTSLYRFSRSCRVHGCVQHSRLTDTHHAVCDICSYKLLLCSTCRRCGLMI